MIESNLLMQRSQDCTYYRGCHLSCRLDYSDMLCHKYNELNAVVYRKSYRWFWSGSDFGSGPDIYRGECEQRNSRTVHWMVSSIVDA